MLVSRGISETASLFLVWNTTRYLRGLFDEGDIRLDAKRPDNVQLIFVQLQQEYDQNEQRIEHKKREHALVPQFNQVTGNASLSWIRERKTAHIS